MEIRKHLYPNSSRSP